ncbi:glycosyltransferase family 2 protein [Oceanicella actignis]|uniref:glycosyltransferase family 2 protein n=1 Tax=Oceanicella actignis TaxID=1189325 RepID=UPI0011E6E648|nr:glycosyltransferase family 2 protein [Oceanicella actignis]TYO88764.1 GT2 family glycosyltransferase [Oceanicella actignis]
MTQPEIAVVIPMFNRAATAPAATRSVLRQTLSPTEVIVVDDASTDGSAAAVEALGDPRLRVLRHERNRGGAAARNTGLRAARARWVAFQDSDDEWLPEKLERQFAAMARFRARTGQEPIGAYCGMIILGLPEADRHDPSKLEYWPRPRRRAALEGDLTESLLRAGSLISTQTFVGRRDAIEKAGGFDETLGALQDWDLFIRLSRLGPIAFEPEPLVLQRFSPNSLTRVPRNRVAALERILEKNAEAFAALPDALFERLVILAGGHRRTGDAAAALRWAWRAVRQRPAHPRAWAALALAAAARLRGARR